MKRAASYGAGVLAMAMIASCTARTTIEIDDGDMVHLDSSPINGFYADVFGRVETDEAEAKAARRADMVREAELVAECMTAQGFEHVPWFPGMNAVADDAEDGGLADLAAMDPMERAEQWGYGVFSGPDAVPANPEAFVDPNQTAVELLSEAEQEAYWAALLGDGTPADLVDGRLTQEHGCSPWAAQEINVVSPRQVAAEAAYDDPRFAELKRAVDDANITFAESRGLATANEAWSVCMADAGFDYGTPEAAEGRFSEVFQDEDWAEHNDRSELVAEEIATAVADQRCRDETDYDETTQQLRWNIEKQVLDRYADDVAALLALVEQSS